MMNNKEWVKAIGYVRVSTEQQASDGVSLSAQREKVEAFARLYDYELVAINQNLRCKQRSMLMESVTFFVKGKGSVQEHEVLRGRALRAHGCAASCGESTPRD
jgi:DNA invertase Pin-like site-specific DNA recombinase